LVARAGRLEAIVIGPAADAHASLRTRCFDSGPEGDSNPAMVLADIVSSQNVTPQNRPALGGDAVFVKYPSTVLSRVQSSQPEFLVTFTEDSKGFYINGKKFEMDADPMLTVDVGSLQ